MPIDLSDEVARALVVETASEQLGGPIDILVNNAAAAIYGDVADLRGTGIRANTIEPRAAVLTEGADALGGGALRPEQVETLEQMVEAVVALCDCPADVTGASLVSLDLLDEWGIEVRGLDGAALSDTATDS